QEPGEGLPIGAGRPPLVAAARRNGVNRLNGVTVGRAGGSDPTAPSGSLSPAPVRPWPLGSPDRGLVKGMVPVADPQQLPAVVIARPAEIDMANADRTGQQLRAALSPGVTTVVADMTATRFCDSSGISMLVQAHGQAAANGTELRLVVASTAVLRTLMLTGLD